MLIAIRKRLSSASWRGCGRAERLVVARFRSPPSAPRRYARREHERGRCPRSLRRSAAADRALLGLLGAQQMVHGHHRPARVLDVQPGQRRMALAQLAGVDPVDQRVRPDLVRDREVGCRRGDHLLRQQLVDGLVERAALERRARARRSPRAGSRCAWAAPALAPRRGGARAGESSRARSRSASSALRGRSAAASWLGSVQLPPA